MTDTLTARRGLAAHLLPAPSAGLGWPRGHVRLAAAERGRLLHYERLMGLAHVTAVPIALAAAVTRVDGGSRPDLLPASAFAAGVLVYALGYHLLLPALWLSRVKVVTGLLVDTALVTAAVRVTGGADSVLVFLYYLIVITSALTLASRALLAICGIVTATASAALILEPALGADLGSDAGRAAAFAASVWVVGLMSAAGAAQMQRAERRLLDALHAQDRSAREKAALSRDLAQRLTETRALAASLDAQREQSRRLAERVLQAQEEERRRVARELHDEANQTLAAMMAAVELAEARAAAAGDAALVSAVARLRRLAASALADLQRIALELRPPALDEFGLAAALSNHVASRTAGTGLHAEVRIEGRRRRLPEGVDVALYRVAQEALANVQKHAAARHVRVSLRFLPGAVRLDVSDDGRGVALDDDAATRPGLGWTGMRERAAMLGGSVEVSGRPGGGTRVSAVVPAPGGDDTEAAA